MLSFHVFCFVHFSSIYKSSVCRFCIFLNSHKWCLLSLSSSGCAYMKNADFHMCFWQLYWDIHIVHLLKVYSSVVFRMCMVFCSHFYCLILQHSYQPRMKPLYPYTHQQALAISILPHCLETTSLLSYKWNQRIYEFLQLSSWTWHNISGFTHVVACVCLFEDGHPRECEVVPLSVWLSLADFPLYQLSFATHSWDFLRTRNCLSILNPQCLS